MTGALFTKRKLLTTSLAVVFLLGVSTVAAQERSGPSQKEALNDPSETLSEIKQRLSKTEALIESSRKKEKAVLDELEQSDRSLAALRKKADMAARKVKSNREKAKDLEAEVAALEEALAHQQDSLAKTLRRLYRQRSPSTAQVLLTASTLTEAAELATYSRRLARIDRERISRYRATLKKLRENKSQLKATSSNLANEQAEADLKAEKLKRRVEAKRKLLASIKKERHSHEKAQREMEAAARELAALIEKMEEEKRANTMFSVETEKEARERSASFSLLKGRLPWPLPGRLLKKTKRDALLHKGIYLEASRGDPIEAVAGGTAVFSDYFRGYGNLCIIDHGASYHTLYAHAEELTVRIGERVVAGQVIGRVGSSGATSSPKLYFELRHRGRPINPMPWMVARAQ